MDGLISLVLQILDYKTFKVTFSMFNIYGARFNKIMLIGRILFIASAETSYINRVMRICSCFLALPENVLLETWSAFLFWVRCTRKQYSSLLDELVISVLSLNFVSSVEQAHW